MLITKKVITKWNSANKKYYVDKGYIFTKMKDEFEVKVEDLSDGSNVNVEVKCDCEDCKNPYLKPIPWYSYLRHVKLDGKYYCNKCCKKLYGNENKVKTKLERGTSFEKWCLDNGRQDVLDRWDYELNDKSPSEVGFSSKGINKKGFWFKCFKYPEHGSELRDCDNFVHGHNTSIECSQCNKIFITNPEYIKYFVNIEDSKKHTIGSAKRVKMKCQECGFIKNMQINAIKSHGFSCPRCSDGIPFTEKTMFNVLEQLDIEFKFQLTRTTLKWCKDYKYDFYINYNNIEFIIETHGEQHYKEKHKNSRFKNTLAETQENDKRKKKLALQNGVKKENYIAIDCRKSEIEWIKNNILESELSTIFDLSSIDWVKCQEYASKSLVKKVCKIWDSGVHNTQKISSQVKIGAKTVRRYLKTGAEIGWCDYLTNKK